LLEEFSATAVRRGRWVYRAPNHPFLRLVESEFWEEFILIFCRRHPGRLDEDKAKIHKGQKITIPELSSDNFIQESKADACFIVIDVSYPRDLTRNASWLDRYA
jgi:hypothetical protein